MPGIVCVVPTVRPECHAQFVKAWAPLFEKHQATLVTVWDGENPVARVSRGYVHDDYLYTDTHKDHRDLFCRRTDACRNLGFVAAAKMNPDYVLTLDDDCLPNHHVNQWRDDDPIQFHLDALQKRVPISWMNTAHDTDLYLRGVPYGVRDEAPVMLSHGVWVGTPDFDGETQLKLEQGATGREPGVPYSLPYYVGPIPKGVLFPLCGMNVMVRKEALPYLYFAPMGPDSGVEGLNRFADIWMGLWVQKMFAKHGWACYSGASTVLHTRKSDARKNFEQEKLGREWNEYLWIVEQDGQLQGPPEFQRYYQSWCSKRNRYANLIRGLQGDMPCQPKDSMKT